MTFQLREEDESRVGRRRWWGGGREVGDRKRVIGKSGLKVIDREEGGGEEECDGGGCIAYSRCVVEEFVEITCEQEQGQCVSPGDSIAGKEDTRNSNRGDHGYYEEEIVVSRNAETHSPVVETASWKDHSVLVPIEAVGRA